jgi:hypothetical protein
VLNFQEFYYHLKGYKIKNITKIKTSIFHPIISIKMLEVNEPQEIQETSNEQENIFQEEKEAPKSVMRGRLTIFLTRVTMYVYFLIFLLNLSRFAVATFMFETDGVTSKQTTMKIISKVYSITCSIPPIFISISAFSALLFIDKVRYRSIQELLLVGVIFYFYF